MNDQILAHILTYVALVVLSSVGLYLICRILIEFLSDRALDDLERSLLRVSSEYEQRPRLSQPRGLT